MFEKFPVFRVSDPDTGAFTFAPWPEAQTLRVLVGSFASQATQARPVRYRLRAGDGSYDQEVALADAKPASSHHVAVEFEDVPLDVRLSLQVGWDGRWAFTVINNVMAAALPGNCTSGRQCKALPRRCVGLRGTGVVVIRPRWRALGRRVASALPRFGNAL